LNLAKSICIRSSKIRQYNVEKILIMRRIMMIIGTALSNDDYVDKFIEKSKI